MLEAILVTNFSDGRSGKIFHWSSSLSKWRRFMILFFSSGGMKFSMIRFLIKIKIIKKENNTKNVLS